MAFITFVMGCCNKNLVKSQIVFLHCDVSDKYDECDNCGLTTEVEEDDDDSTVNDKSTRRKRKTDEDFVGHSEGTLGTAHTHSDCYCLCCCCRT